MNPFIIAEVGSNFRCLEDCIKSVHIAKDCGADAVKFQYFTHYSLYGTVDKEWDKKHPSLPLLWIRTVAEECDIAGIEFMCTAFQGEELKTIDLYVKRHKVASSNMGDIDMLQTLSKLGKPVILSTGSWLERSIEKSVSALLDVPTITILLCDATYPTKYLDLRNIDKLYDMQIVKDFEIGVGLSDHSLDVDYYPYAAVHHHNAVCLEKHVNFFGLTDTDDALHSLNRSQFKRYCLSARAQSKPHLPMNEDMVQYHHAKYDEKFGRYVRRKP